LERVSITIGSMAAMSGVFNEIECNLDSSFGNTLMCFRCNGSYYIVLSGYTVTMMLFPDSKLASNSPNASRNFSLFLIRFENIPSAVSYPIMTSKVSVG
jgi:hypothetical protein